jgi:hypothetical protein
MENLDRALPHDVALANRIIERFGLSNAFGHVSARLPGTQTFLFPTRRSPGLQLRMLTAAGGDASRLRVYTREEAERVGDQLGGGPLARAWEYYSTAAEQRPLGG